MTDETTMTQKIHEYADENDATMLLCDPQNLYNDAILGVFDDEDGPRVVYSKQKMVEALAAAFELYPHDVGEEPDHHSDAAEFLEYNTFNANVGPEGPIYIDDLSDRC